MNSDFMRFEFGSHVIALRVEETPELIYNLYVDGVFAGGRFNFYQAHQSFIEKVNELVLGPCAP